VLAIGLAAAAMTGCSAESLAEQALEAGIERAAAAEGNDIDLELDLDFDSEGGGINFSSPDGEGSVTFDGEGGFDFSSPDGDGSVTFTEDGVITFETDEGNGTMTFDEEQGDMLFESDEGTVSFTTDDDDGFTMVDADGVTTSVSSEPSAGWPIDLGIPASTNADENLYTMVDEADATTFGATLVRDEANDFASQAINRLVAAGWEVESAENQPGLGQSASLTKGQDTAQISVFGELLTVMIVQQK